MENRSNDLRQMNLAIEDLIHNKSQIETIYPLQFSNVSDIIDAVSFCEQQLSMLLVANKEPMANRQFIDSAFVLEKYSEYYDFIEWRLIQSFNAFMGSRLIINHYEKGQAQKSSIKTKQLFFKSDPTKDEVTQQLLATLVVI
jgi:hypothetical protein